MARLSRDQRNQAIGMSIAGLSFSRIANHLNVHRITICRLLRRQRQTGGVADARRTGLPRVTTAGQDRYIVNVHLRLDFFKQHSILKLKLYAI